jgi:hypothetical protein
VILAFSERSSADVYLGQLKTLLEQPERLRCEGDVALQWNFARPLETLQSRLEPEHWELVSLLVATLNNRRRIAALCQNERWHATPELALAAPWPDAVAHATPSV